MKSNISPDSEIQVGDTLGRYQIFEKIGQGGMGSVYAAVDPMLNRTVALKVLLKRATQSVDTLQREAQVMAQLQHANIISVYDIGIEQGQVFFTMDYIEGASLKEAKSNLTLQQKIEIVIKIANAINYAHNKKIIHRDLKPSNVMINKEGEPKVMDFGLARLPESKQTLTNEGELIGTLAYMSPEQAEGKKEEIDGVSDVYSLGAILYEMLYGKPPFSGVSTFELIYQLLEKPPTLPNNTSIPKELENICLKAMEKPKDKRYQSAKEFAQALQSYSKKKLAIKKYVFSLLLILIVFFAFFIWQKHQNKEKAEKFFVLGEKNFNKGNIAKAIKYYTKAIALAPTSKYHNYRGTTYYQQKKYNKALIEFNQAIKLGPKNHRAYRNKGAVYYHQKKHTKALSAYAMAVSLAPNDAVNHYELSQFYLRINQVDKFFVSVNKAISLKPKGAYYLFRGEIYYAQRKYQKALEDFSMAIKKNPNLAKTYIYRSLILGSMGKISLALVDVNKAIKLQPNLANLYFNRGLLYKKQNKLLLAVQDFKHALKLAPKAVFAQEALGYVGSIGDKEAEKLFVAGEQFSNKRQFDKAIACLNQAISIKAKAKYYNQLGVVYYQQQKNQKAILHFQSALKLNPKSAQAYANLAVCYSRINDFNKAVFCCKKTIEWNPANVSAYNTLGYIYYKFKKHLNAINAYNQAIALNSKYQEAYKNRAFAYLKLGKLQQALADFTTSIRLKPSAQTYANRGAIYFQMKKYLPAIEDFSKSLTLAKSATAYLNRAQVYAQLGKHKEAVLDFRQYLQIAPASPNKNQILAYIRQHSK